MASDKALNIALISVGVVVTAIGGILLYRKFKGSNKIVDYKPALSDKKLPKNFAEIPGGGNNYRCNQPTLSQFKYIFKKFPKIKYVIRLNGEEGTGVTPASEKSLVESSGRKYIAPSAHKGYQSGKGYTQSIKNILPYLLKGNTLIHCTHGADRTGYIVAAYLKEIGYRNWSDEDLWEYTIKYNSWKSSQKICKPGSNWGYVKYLEGFYPVKKWCKAKSSRKFCSPCV